LGVFRFAWFAVRTLFGVIALILAGHVALSILVTVHSVAARDVDPNATLNRVKSYNEQRAHSRRATTTQVSKSQCEGAVAVACDQR